jgi:hypothetical protein
VFSGIRKTIPSHKNSKKKNTKNRSKKFLQETQIYVEHENGTPRYTSSSKIIVAI